jgi:predicted RecA/RadA family phage recombinase
MGLATYRSVGDMIDYTPSGNVAEGDVVVQGSLIGVATRAIVANVLGALAVTGVFDMPKATGSASAITAGTILYWDASGEVVTSSNGGGANKQFGKAIVAASDDDTTVRVIKTV